jgi:hypothetical protein
MAARFGGEQGRRDLAIQGGGFAPQSRGQPVVWIGSRYSTTEADGMSRSSRRRKHRSLSNASHCYRCERCGCSGICMLRPSKRLNSHAQVRSPLAERSACAGGHCVLPSWPEPLSPQQYAFPDGMRLQLCLPPALTAAKVRSVETRAGTALQSV